MHLTKRILSFITAEALRGNTWAGDNVLDSPGDIGSIRVADEGGIFVAVYCDEWDNKSDFEPEETEAKTPGSFRLVIEVGAAKPITTERDEDGPVTQIAATDDGLEWSIAFISRQCVDTILDTRPAFPWSNLLQRFIDGKLLRYQIRRGGTNNEGKGPAPRYASCVSILKVSVICMEPPRGQLVTPQKFPIWSDLLTMMSEREDLAGLSKLIRAHFEPVDGQELRDDVVDAQRMWVSAETMATLGLADENSVRYAPGSGGAVSPEMVRADVPLNSDDMQRWLAEQGPDPSQGTPNARR